MTLAPLVTLIWAQGMAGGRIHRDDTTVPVPARGKTATGRLWTHARDDRPFGGEASAAAFFCCTRDRGREHPWRHPAGYAGIPRADAHARFNELHALLHKPGPITETTRWAHSRRSFFSRAQVAKAPLTLAAVRRTDATLGRLSYMNFVAMSVEDLTPISS